MVRCTPQVPVAVQLRRLFPTASFVGCGDICTGMVTDRSADCVPGAMFAVVRGVHHDGRDFIEDAVNRGASSLLVDFPVPHVGLSQCVVPNVRKAYAELCTALMVWPSRSLGLTGVTGTNGKTTIAWLVRSILKTAGHPTGLLGTIEYSDGTATRPSSLTTPDSRTFTQWLGAMVAKRTTHAAIELSSHALDQCRTSGTLLDVAIVSNITQDHFDYHHNFEAYRRSKMRIFENLKPAGLAVVNLDDAGSRSCLEEPLNRVTTYALEHSADVTALVLDESWSGSTFRLSMGAEQQIVKTHLIGRHNISNCLAAAAAAAHFGVSLADIARGIEALDRVPGRMERVDAGQSFPVLVDYAHTDDALNRSVQFLKRLTRGRVICVFGAGGDRDRTKRPLLGKAGAGADIPIVTSDNPRTENPQDIIEQVVSGVTECGRIPFVEVDRERAIQLAVDMAREDDCVLIAGKGNETEQIIGTTGRRFDDREVAARLLARRHGLGEPHLTRRALWPISTS